MSYVLDAGNENSKVIHITSTDATNSLSSDGAFLSYDLETPIITPQDQDTLVSLYSAVVPYSFYNIRSDVNDKVFYRLLSAPGVPQFFQIPEGSYTINSLKTELETQFNLIGTTTTTIGFNRTTMKFTYSQTQKGGSGLFVDWYFDFNSTTSYHGGEVALGLPINYEGNGQEFILRSGSSPNIFDFVSPDVPDVNGDTHSLNIRTNLTSKGCIDSHTKSFSTILGTMPIDVNFGGVIFFRPADAIHKIIIQQKVVKTITIRLTDDRDRLLDLNGLSFNITLLVDHIKHGRDMRRRIQRPIPKIKQQEKRGRPTKEEELAKKERTKKDIPIPLIN